MDRTYIAIDLKSFFASVEAVERNLDPLKTCLVVADESRTEKTICLAVTPALKAYGLPGRCRLYEVIRKAQEVEQRTGKKLDYIIAKPRMELYMKYSAQIYQIYLKYFSAQDIHVYSIDEVFIDVTSYLKLYKSDAHSLVVRVIKDVLSSTGITATAGIADNLYLCKIAMDIEAKHTEADADGARIASITEREYREKYWAYTPITDFWGVGKGTAKRLADMGIYTMGDIARKSLKNEKALYKAFGVNAEILIDHAWGVEPCTMKHIKEYRSASKSFCEGQVLPTPYTVEKARIVVREMSEILSQRLVASECASDSFNLILCYDSTCITPEFNGEIQLDYYGKAVPKSSHGLTHIRPHTSSMVKINSAVTGLFDKIVKKDLLIRRIYLSAVNIISQKEEQYDLFSDIEKQNRQKKLQKTMLEIQRRYGKNAILKAEDYVEGATIRERNMQIGGHRS